MGDDENWYEWYRGTPSTFEPEFGDLYTGYSLDPGRMGDTTNPSLADQVSAVSEKLRQGMKTIEAGTVSPELFETIPKQHFEKLKDLAKLTGAEITVHSPFAPHIDMVGLDEKGGWSESNRIEAERRLMNVIEKSHEINPEGNVPITIHATMAPTGEWLNEKEKESIGVINPDTGEFGMIPGKKHITPSILKQANEWRKRGISEEEIQNALMKPSSPKHELKSTNHSIWLNQLNELESKHRGASDMLRDARIDSQKIQDEFNFQEINKKIMEKKELTEKEQLGVQRYEDLVMKRIKDAKYILEEDLGPAISTTFNKAYADKNVRKKLIQAGEKYNEIMEQYAEYEKKGNIINAVNTLRDAQASLLADFERKNEKTGEQIIQPRAYVPMEEFAQEKASDTISSLALKSYDKFKQSAPIMAIENLFPGIAFANAEELKGLIEESRKKFVGKAIEEGMGKAEAKKQAEKLIGATWDIGHIHQMKKHGAKEDFLVKQTKQISPYIKKVHVTDNFGYADTHLAPGMGDVPVKKHMKEIEKAGFKGKVIAEMGGLHTQFKVPSAYPYALEAMGSGLYSPTVASYWGRTPSRAALIPESDYSWAPISKELGGKSQKQQYSTK